MSTSVAAGSESLFDNRDHSLSISRRCRRSPPGIYIMGRTIVQVMKKAQSPTQRDGMSKLGRGEGLERPFRVLGEMGGTGWLSHSGKNTS